VDILNIEEVCKAFLYKRELESDNGNRYKMDKGELWVLSNSISSEWEKTISDYPFTHPLRMRLYEEYNLTFHQAMFISSLKKVKSEKTSYVYHMRDGVLYTESDVIMGLDVCEIGSKWKVVE